MAWYKKYKKFYPVCSLRSASSVKDLVDAREWVRNFDEVVLWFDSDEAGQEAAKEAARIMVMTKLKLLSQLRKMLLMFGFMQQKLSNQKIPMLLPVSNLNLMIFQNYGTYLMVYFHHYLKDTRSFLKIFQMVYSLPKQIVNLGI